MIRPSLLRSGDIIAVIDDLGDERAYLIGHSMGAWLAVGVAKYHPARLSSLVSPERDGVLQTTALAIEDGRIRRRLHHAQSGQIKPVGEATGDVGTGIAASLNT